MTSVLSQKIGLLILRIAVAGLIFWWGLVKGLNTGAGQSVSDTFYGGTFSYEILLIVFGWGQVVLALLVALGLFRVITLPIMFVMNAFVAVAVRQSLIDPFWMWHVGEKPETVNPLFYPSIIIAAACWVLVAFRHHDTLALDRIKG